MLRTPRRGRATPMELGPGQRPHELVASCDPELWIDPVKVRGNRAVRHVKLLADLAVREALGSEVRDLEFLRCQVVAGDGVAPPARFTRCAQLASRLFSES